MNVMRFSVSWRCARNSANGRSSHSSSSDAAAVAAAVVAAVLASGRRTPAACWRKTSASFVCKPPDSDASVRTAIASALAARGS